jgi:hypothetical protein
MVFHLFAIPRIALSAGTILILFFLRLGLPPGGEQPAAADAPPPGHQGLLATQHHAIDFISFRENKGQVRDQHGQPRRDVLYSAEKDGLLVHFRADGLHYQLHQMASEPSALPPRFGRLEEGWAKPSRISIQRVEVAWVGADPEACIEAGDALPGYENYYNVPEGAAPALEVQQYRSLRYRGLYPGIDLHYYAGPEGGLKYDFIVQPGADYEQIALAVAGAELSVDEEERLILSTPLGQIVEGRLYVHQEGRPIAARWAVRGQEARIAISGSYDPDLPLVIDPPVRAWGTYYGGGGDTGTSCATDGIGNVYLAGASTSASLIATVGAHQEQLAGEADAFLAKFDREGQRLWGTYYGGTGVDVAINCAVDPQGHVLLAGLTDSESHIATPGAHQDSLGGGLYDAFLAKFNPEGQLLWGTYYGGEGIDYGHACAIDAAGAIYLAGSTTSLAAIATPGAHQESQAGGDFNAFLAKFNRDGQRLWGTYYGGEGLDWGFSCAVDGAGDVYLSGMTKSGAQIATPDAHQEEYRGEGDAFLVKFSAEGQRRWGTYYGGSGYEDGGLCTVDAWGDVYLSGTTGSDSMATPGVHQDSLAVPGSWDAFLAKFDRDGQRLWGTYYGGEGLDWGTSCAADGDGQVFLTGWTTSSAQIATPGAHQESHGGGAEDYDAFLARFDRDGLLNWATYYGGERMDTGSSCAVDPCGNVFLAGESSSPQHIATPGAHQEDTLAAPRAFLAQFARSTVRSDTLRSATCGSYTHLGITYTLSGVYTQSLTTAAGCDSTLILDLTIDSDVFDLSLSVEDGPVLWAAETDATYQWLDCATGEALPGATQQSFTPEASGHYAVALARGECRDTSACAEVFVVSTAALGTVLRQATLFPNPNRGQFTLELPWPAEAALHDAMGRLLFRQPYAAGEHELALDAPPGVYLLVLRHGGGVQVVRVVRR